MLWNIFIVSDASEVSGATFTVNLPVSVSHSSLAYNNATYGDVTSTTDSFVDKLTGTVHTEDYYYFHFMSDWQYAFSGSSSVYAYRINLINNNPVVRRSQVINQSYVVGAYPDLRSGLSTKLLDTNNATSVIFWYINDYADKDIFLALDSYLFQYTISYLGNTDPYFSTASYSLSSDVTLQVTPYTLAGYEKEIANNTDEINNKLDETNDTLKDTNETTKGIFASIKEFFGSFFQNLINAVIGLFVPSAEEMSDLFDQLNQFFSDRFGFLYAPFDYMIKLMQVFLSSTGTTGLTLPGFTIMGYEVWGNLTYDLSSDPLVGTILGYVRIGTGTLLSGYFIMFLQQFFKERFGSG